MPDRAGHPPIGDDALREIVVGTSSETGERFFDVLVKHLARALKTKCAWITEYIEDERRLNALSFWVDDGYFGDFAYDIAHTPCEMVIDQRQLIHIPDRLLELYQGDPTLKPLGALSYIGIPLLDTDDRILGHLAVLHDAPMAPDPTARAIFEIFAGRASAELQRLRRDRDLREREQKLSRLIDSAMDAIVELDGDLRVTRMNPAAEELLRCAAPNVRGKEFGVFLTRDSRGKLIYMINELNGQPQGRQALWIADGLAAIRAGGAEFRAEGTLSRYELEGRPFFSLIIRDIEERLAAEERIRRLSDETAYLREEIAAMHGFDEIIGESAALRALLADVDRVAGSDTTVLIVGETGTGKELVARAIHRRSPRANGPLVSVNCAAIATNLQESEFFGHEKGAFTGATQRREGRFKLAHGGTIFLDEIGEMPLDLQAKLLRVLQTGEFEPVGSSRTEHVDVRVIAATNRDLETRIREAQFRNDLYYRLNVFPLVVPPLRERGDDVVLLAEAFARRFARRAGRSVAALTDACTARLKRYDWPGNVRELENVIERAFLTSVDGRRLNLDRALPASEPRDGTPAPVATASVDHVLTVAELRELERANIVRALELANGKVSGPGGAAERLGINPNTLTSRMASLGIDRARG